MDYVLLPPDEVGALLNLSTDDVVRLVETGKLAGLWRVGENGRNDWGQHASYADATPGRESGSRSA